MGNDLVIRIFTVMVMVTAHRSGRSHKQELTSTTSTRVHAVLMSIFLNPKGTFSLAEELTEKQIILWRRNVIQNESPDDRL